MTSLNSTEPMMCEIVDADYLGGHRLHLKFNDGLEGDIDLAGHMTKGVFQPLADEGKFTQFGLIYGTLVWKPNGSELDIAPEYLYQQIYNSLPEGSAKHGFSYFNASSWN